MHHNHSTRPQHSRQHMSHQGPMHHPSAVGMNMGPQAGPQQRHLSNIPPPHGTNAPIGQFIPPQQRSEMNRFNHHNQPRLQQPMHQQTTQSKLRATGGHSNGLLNTALPPSHQQQQQSQHHQSSKFQPGAISHQPNLAKQSLKHATPSLQNKLSAQSSKKILSHLSHPPPNLIGPQNLSKLQAQGSTIPPSNLVPTTNTVNSKPTVNAQKHVTILTKPPPTIPQLPITQPPPLTIASAKSSNLPQSQASQLQNIQDADQKHLIQSKSVHLHGPNATNQSTISSTTNSVMVSITHQQTQQTVIVQQQQQQMQQAARQGQSFENQPPIVSILQNPNRISDNKVPKEPSSELNGNEIVGSILTECLANSKEKTPMCLVNELARYNRIQHQYRLTSETGPAHAKRFTVTLKLGDEEYTADGLSIKKAQHLAAADAISKTKYQHPPPKSHRLKSKLKAGAGTITPTVELNALAMKLGEPTVYLLDNDPRSTASGGQPQLQTGPNLTQPVGGPQAPPPGQYPSQNNMNYFPPNQYQNFNRPNIPNGMYNAQRFPGAGFGRRPFTKGPMKFGPNDRMAPYNTSREPCRVTLVVGMRKFVGVGASLQAARHDAATRALEVIKPLVDETAPESNDDSTAAEDANSDLKSPISLVHEIALKRNLSVTFEVVSERGQPHMKTFITKCQVGDIVTEGEGNGKKLSKKRAALNMLDELRKLPPISPSRITPTASKIKAAQKQRKPPQQQQPVKRKTRNIIKEQSQGSEVEEEVNPISRLIQIQQALKEREPIYTVVEERGAPRRREFVIEVSASGQTARGIGTNKKMAKRLAAENLLTLLGLNSAAAPNAIKDVGKLVNNNTSNTNNNIENPTEKTHRAKFLENVDAAKSTNVSSTQGRQIVPGILLMQQQKQQQQQQQTQSVLIPPAVNNGSMNGTHENNEPSVSSTVTASTSSSFANTGVRPKDQLMYLGQLLGFQVQYSDYPKGNHGAYLSIVTLTTDPPQLCHGAGNNIEESQDEASLTALRILSELGLDNVKPKKSNAEEIKA